MPSSYLQNGNILAARTFIQQFTSSLSGSSRSPNDQVAVGSFEVTITADPVLNFAQLAVVTCQRAQGDQSKLMRESWIRLCGTYQVRGGLLAEPDVRRVRNFSISISFVVSILIQVLNDIGQLYFSIQPPRNQTANPFGEMLSSLFGGPSPAAPSNRRVLTPASNASGLD